MSDTTDYMLTTVDNPFNPWTHFEEWNAYDQSKGYHTLSYLARIANVSYELSDYDVELAERDAIDRIVSQNILGLYRKVPEPRKS